MTHTSPSLLHPFHIKLAFLDTYTQIKVQINKSVQFHFVSYSLIPMNMKPAPTKPAFQMFQRCHSVCSKLPTSASKHTLIRQKNALKYICYILEILLCFYWANCPNTVVSRHIKIIDIVELMNFIWFYHLLRKRLSFGLKKTYLWIGFQMERKLSVLIYFFTVLVQSLFTTVEWMCLTMVLGSLNRPAQTSKFRNLKSTQLFHLK